MIVVGKLLFSASSFHNSYDNDIMIFFQKMVPFDEFFEVLPLQHYHRVILAKTFVDNFAPTKWSVDQRVAFCYVQDKDEAPCTTSNEFFDEFWKYVGIPTFTSVQNIKGLRFDSSGAEDWRTK